MAYRVGIIGFGGAGEAHYSYYSCVPSCRVTRIYDPKPERLARAALVAPSVERTDDLDSFWAGLDIVSICTPDSTHANYIVSALERGINAISEKPITDSLEGVRAIKHAQEKYGGVVAGLHQMRFVPVNVKAKRVIDSGELGAVSYLEGLYVHNLTERAWVNDDWRRRDNATPLVYSGCHFVDLLRWFDGSEVEEVFAAANHLAFPEYPESDLNLVTMRFASGVIGKVLVAFGSTVPQDHSIKIYGSQGSIENNVLFTGQGKWTRVIHSPSLLEWKLLRDPNKASNGIYRQLRRNIPAWTFDKIFSGLRYMAPHTSGYYGARFYPMRLYEHALACVDAIEDFVGAIDNKRTPLCSMDESSRTVLACLAGVESYRTNQPVRVKRLEEVC